MKKPSLAFIISLVIIFGGYFIYSQVNYLNSSEYRDAKERAFENNISQLIENARSCKATSDCIMVQNPGPCDGQNIPVNKNADLRKVREMIDEHYKDNIACPGFFPILGKGSAQCIQQQCTFVSEK